MAYGVTTLNIPCSLCGSHANNSEYLCLECNKCYCGVHQKHIISSEPHQAVWIKEYKYMKTNYELYMKSFKQYLVQQVSIIKEDINKILDNNLQALHDNLENLCNHLPTTQSKYIESFSNLLKNCNFEIASKKAILMLKDHIDIALLSRLNSSIDGMLVELSSKGTPHFVRE